MNVIRWKIVPYIVLAVVAIVSLVNWFFSDRLFTFEFVIDCIVKSVSLITVLSGMFCAHFWKCKLFSKWLVLVPDLNGKWTGYICSDWIDPQTGEKAPNVIANLTIKQSLFKTSCVIKSNESSSRSLVSQFLIDEENQVLKLTYIYQNEPDQIIQDRSRIHFGTTMFDICYRNNGYVLTGKYWTNRGTSGQIKFSCQEK